MTVKTTNHNATAQTEKDPQRIEEKKGTSHLSAVVAAGFQLGVAAVAVVGVGVLAWKRAAGSSPDPLPVDVDVLGALLVLIVVHILLHVLTVWGICRNLKYTSIPAAVWNSLIGVGQIYVLVSSSKHIGSGYATNADIARFVMGIVYLGITSWAVFAFALTAAQQSKSAERASDEESGAR